MSETEPSGPSNFVFELIESERQANASTRVQTRFPPEPNGYLHVGHAKSICLNFGLAKAFSGLCNLRFDDTNPSKEKTEYVQSIIDDIKWLGFTWDKRQYFASGYFETIYKIAESLVERNLAYVDSQNLEEIREHRGNFHKPGKDSPYRARTVDESLTLFREMKAGKHPDGAHVLRAKIDMQHKNINMRDPVLYRIMHAEHHRTGNSWCIYPMYDFAHPISDAIEDITHSVCTLEFEDHRPLYDWCVENAALKGKPRQIEFARLNLTYTVLSKRKLLSLVEGGHVEGWDDPRMPTISGMRRAGIPAPALISFCDRIGVSKRPGIVDVSLFEHAIREELNKTSPRYMGVLRPLKLTITNFPEGEEIYFDEALFPGEPERGTRKIPFCRDLVVEQDDYREEAPKKWFRLAPGKEVRLRYACYVTVSEVIKDDDGRPVELRCTWDPESKGGKTPDGRRVKGTIHWVSTRHGVPATARLFDRLFNQEFPEAGEEGTSFMDALNPQSLETIENAIVEPACAELPVGTKFQLERLAYFCVDRTSTKNKKVLNRTIALRDSWAKIEKKLGK